MMIWTCRQGLALNGRGHERSELSGGLAAPLGSSVDLFCLFAETVTKAVDEFRQQFSSRQAPSASSTALERKFQFNLLVAIGNREHVGAKPVRASFARFYFRDDVGVGIASGMS
jgi:hypothetical protein